MNATLERPAPEKAAERAKEMLTTLEADPEFARLARSCKSYDEAWTDFTGYALLDGYDVRKDTDPLFPEAIRAMVIKSAVYELTDGNEDAAEIPVPVPLDVMIHALAAQFTVLSRIQERTGIKFVHATDREAIGAGEPGDYTHQVYRAAWGPVNDRYWLGKDETERRTAIVTRKYEQLGIYEAGRRIAPGFATAAA
ncbi:hypothetical protein [Streptomyces boncukensis]